MRNIITEESILEFERGLRESEKSRATIEKYTASLRRLAAWLGGEGITKEKLIEYREYLREKGFAVSTINGTLSTINGYLAMCGLEDCRVKFLRCQRRAFRPAERELTRGEFDRLVRAAGERGDERTALVMETICSTGIRVSELKYITVEAAGSGRAEIALKGKIRTILMPRKLCRKLLSYAKKNNRASGEIFVSRNGRPLSRKQVWAGMKALCEAAGVEPAKVFPHNLRHLFARCFYRSSRDVVKLADVLGHSSVETTRIYLMSTGEEHAKTIEKLRLVS